MRNLWAAWPLLQKKIVSKESLLLFLDFDGTLAPIAAHPSLVRVKKETQKIVHDLSRLPSVRVAIISGRGLSDIRSLFFLRGLIFGGNHGLEIAGIAMPIPAVLRKARRGVARLRALKQEIAEALRPFSGVWVQDKRYTLSVHFRALTVSSRRAFGGKLRQLRATKTARAFDWRAGKKVWEIRPLPRWDKGDFVKLLMKCFPRALPIAIGDDDTDEDMFRVLLRKGIAVRVGEKRGSQAAYGVASPDEVVRWLRELWQLRAQ